MTGFHGDRRADEREWMDTETVPYEDFRACLADLARVNRLTFAYRPTLAFLERLRRDGRLGPERPFTVVDVGSGYGDMLRAVGRWARQRALDCRLVGVDLNPWSTRAAEEATAAEDDAGTIAWETADAFDYAARRAERPDIVLSALFTHHLTDGEVIRFLRWMEETARVGWFVNDLHRHAVSYYGFTALSTLARWHRFVRHDGPLSIARAFVADDWERLLAGAGLDGRAEVRWHMPFRLCVARVHGPT